MRDATLTEKQQRMLAAGKFHFSSNREDYDNYKAAMDLEARGLITISERCDYGAQETTYNCTAKP